MMVSLSPKLELREKLGLKTDRKEWRCNTLDYLEGKEKRSRTEFLLEFWHLTLEQHFLNEDKADLNESTNLVFNAWKIMFSRLGTDPALNLIHLSPQLGSFGKYIYSPGEIFTLLFLYRDLFTSDDGKFCSNCNHSTKFYSCSFVEQTIF